MEPTVRDEPDLLKLHLAEYDALTTRCTYYIALHVGIWGVAVALLAAMVEQWSKNHEALTIWIGMTAAQGLLQIWVTLIEDQYLTVSYIERELRFSISTGLPGVSPHAFWRYEQFLGRKRRTESWWGEWIAPMLVFILLGLLVWWRWMELLLPTIGELLLLIVNVLLLVVLSIRTHQRVQLRLSFARQAPLPLREEEPAK